MGEYTRGARTIRGGFPGTGVPLPLRIERLEVHDRPMVGMGLRSIPGGRAVSLFLTLALLAMVTGCARGKSVNPLLPTPTIESASPAVTSSPELARKPCQDGVLRIEDIPAIDAVWQDQLKVPNLDALDWHGDAQLVQLRIACALFGSGFRVQPSYFSAQAQAVFAQDTRESQPVNLDPAKVESLPLDAISFQTIYDALIGADFTEGLALDPSTGIELRVNSEQSPYGPSNIPIGALVAHVSIEQSGQIKDLFIDLRTGKIYTFGSPG